MRSITVWLRVLGGLGALTALIALLALTAALLAGQPEEDDASVLPALLTPVVLLVIGLAVTFVCAAFLARKSGRRFRAWTLGLDVIFEPFWSRLSAHRTDTPVSAGTDGSIPQEIPGQAHDLIKRESAGAPPSNERESSPLSSPESSGRGPAPYRPRFVPLWNNVVSYVGFFLIATSLILMMTFALFSLVTPGTNPYVDIVGYLVLPGMLVLGLLIVPCGIFLKSWRLRRRDPTQPLAFAMPRIDFNDPVQRRAAKMVVAFTFIMMPVVGVSSYHAYHYSDSAEFCSQACHAVMEPQATTYETSPHARVACAECHIGSGASWFVKSKISGTRQIFATLWETYPRPIPPAITELRPARETCERCHWPQKFYGAQLRRIVHFASNESNTRSELDMLLKIGGGDETMGRPEGIHAHMALQGRIEYVATDENLQEIPWVRYVDKQGTEWIYRSDGKPSSDPKPAGQSRAFDCMDCHNRPAHKFRAPQVAVDIYLNVGRIDTTLPYIKREAVAALAEPYPDRETALARIGARILTFYEEQYPAIWESRRASINQAVDMIRQIYNLNFFPRMKVDWRTYPDNIGHKYSAGCFRCHDGRHVNQRGEKLSHECGICHTFLNPVAQDGAQGMVQEGEFRHPIELVGSHAAMRCDQCHDGGFSRPATCAGCHTDQQAFMAGALPILQRFDIKPDPMYPAVTCDACHDLTQPTTVEAIDGRCMECHEDEAERFEGMLAGWKDEVTHLFKQARGLVSPDQLMVLDALRHAGPLHNMEATRAVFRTLLPQVKAQIEQPQTPGASR